MFYENVFFFQDMTSYLENSKKKNTSFSQMFFRCQALLTDKLIPGATTAEAKARRHNGTAARHAIRTIKPTWDTDLFKKNKVSIKIIYIYII